MFSQQEYMFHPLADHGSPCRRNSIDFSDTFSQNMASPLSHDFDEEYQSIYDSVDNPLEIHRRSANDIYQQTPIFIPGSIDPYRNDLAMSAPAGYDYNSLQNSASGTSTSNSLPRSYHDDYSAQINLQMIMEKKQKRRESHNAVERRRRDNINEKIQELCDLLPDIDHKNILSKPNKGVILKKSVEHIRQLQKDVQSSHQRIQDLENTLKMYQQKTQ